jgi:ketosteroid isomerase-like protein
VSEHILGIYKNPHIVRSEYRNPQTIVSDGGDLAVLTYNLNSFVGDEAGGEKLHVSWNCTEVYSRIEANWRIVHSHWSFTQHPAIMQNPTA